MDLVDSSDRAKSVVSSKDLMGRRVVSEDGHHLGDVVRLGIDTATWRVSTIAVRLRRDLLEALGLEKPLLGSQIIWMRADELSPGRSLILGIALADLRGRFTDNDRDPDLNETSPAPRG